MTKIYAALECVLFGVGFAAAGGTNHLTWWNAVLLALTDAAYVWDSDDKLFRRLWQASACLSTLVQLTVLCMSLIGCNMIRDTLKEVGPWTYYFGNFALHYWPTIRTTAIRPTFPKNNCRINFDAARIVAIYATLFKPEVVYSCDNISAYLILPLGIAVAVLLEILITNATTDDTPSAIVSLFSAKRSKDG